MARANVDQRAGGSHFVSRLFLTINVALFVLMALVQVGERGAEAFIANPTPPVFDDFGGLYPPLIAHGQWWRLVTPNFLHLGLIHVIFNSLVLYQIGPQVEEILGSQKFIFVYLCTGVLSMAASFVFNIETVGASGSLFGLLGLLAVYGYRLGGVFGRALMRQMLIWAGLGILISMGFLGFRGNNTAHIAGFITGAALGFVLTHAEPASARSLRWWNVVAVGCALAITSSFVMVALNYGKMQQGSDAILKLSRRMKSSYDLLQDSFEWSKGSSRTAADIATTLENGAREIEILPSVDQRSDRVRGEFVALVRKRATLFAAVEQNPRALAETNDSDARELGRIFAEYKIWEASVITKYRLQYTEPRIKG